MTVGELLQIRERQGLAEGLNLVRKGILELLATKGTVSDSLRERVSGEKNPQILEAWQTLAIQTTTPQEFENQMGAE